MKKVEKKQKFNEIEILIKKHYNIYDSGDENNIHGYDQAVEVGVDDEIIMLRKFARDLLTEIKKKPIDITTKYWIDNNIDYLNKRLEE